MCVSIYVYEVIYASTNTPQWQRQSKLNTDNHSMNYEQLIKNKYLYLTSFWIIFSLFNCANLLKIRHQRKKFHLQEDKSHSVLKEASRSHFTPFYSYPKSELAIARSAGFKLRLTVYSADVYDYPQKGLSEIWRKTTSDGEAPHLRSVPSIATMTWRVSTSYGHIY